MKVALARALVHDPAHIVLDEATNGLDVVATRAACARHCARLAGRRRQVSSFSPTSCREVEWLCDEVVVVAHGRTVPQGTVAELRARGTTDFEEAFVRLAYADEGRNRHDAGRAPGRSKPARIPRGSASVPADEGLSTAWTVFAKGGSTRCATAARWVVLLSSVLMGPLVLVALSGLLASFESRAERARWCWPAPSPRRRWSTTSPARASRSRGAGRLRKRS